MIFVPHKNVTPTGNHGFHPNTGLPGHIFPSLARSRLLELQSSGSSLAPGGRESGKILGFQPRKMEMNLWFFITKSNWRCKFNRIIMNYHELFLNQDCLRIFGEPHEPYQWRQMVQIWTRTSGPRHKLCLWIHLNSDWLNVQKQTVTWTFALNSYI